MSDNLEILNKELVSLLSYFIEKYGDEGIYFIKKEEFSRMMEKKGIRFTQGIEVVSNPGDTYIRLQAHTSTMFGQN